MGGRGRVWAAIALAAGAVAAAALTALAVYIGAPAATALALSAMPEDERSSVIEVGDALVPYADTPRAEQAPRFGAGLWAGSDDVDDGSYGYFVGHNPGFFAGVMDLRAGDPVTVWDRTGDRCDYLVSQVFDVGADARLSDVIGRFSREGEAVVLQTCNGDDLMRIVVALPVNCP